MSQDASIRQKRTDLFSLSCCGSSRLRRRLWAVVRWLGERKGMVIAVEVRRTQPGLEAGVNDAKFCSGSSDYLVMAAWRW